MADNHQEQRNLFPPSVVEFIATPAGKTFLKRQALIATIIMVLSYFGLAALVLSVVIHRNTYLPRTVREAVFILLAPGVLLAQSSVIALRDQMILFSLFRRTGTLNEAKQLLPFRKPKILLITGISLLLISGGLISCLTG